MNSIHYSLTFLYYYIINQSFYYFVSHYSITSFLWLLDIGYLLFNIFPVCEHSEKIKAEYYS